LRIQENLTRSRKGRRETRNSRKKAQKGGREIWQTDLHWRYGSIEAFWMMAITLLAAYDSVFLSFLRLLAAISAFVFPLRLCCFA
jgi:hypothetical protein